MPCEEKVVRLEAEIQGLKNVIDDQRRYIRGLHNSQAQQLEHIPNSHLGPDNLYRGRERFLSEIHACVFIVSAFTTYLFTVLPAELAIHKCTSYFPACTTCPPTVFSTMLKLC